MSFAHIIFVHLRVEHLGTLQCLRDTLADISRAHVLFEFGLMHQARGLLSSPAKNQSPARPVHDVRKILQSLQSGGVDRGHVPQPQYDDRRKVGNTGDNFLDFVRRSKKERSMDAEDGDVGWNFLVLQNMRMTFTQILVCHFRDGRCLRHFSYENQRGENHPGFHSRGQVREHSQ